MDTVWEELTQLGVNLLYSEEDADGKSLIYGSLSKDIRKETLLRQCPLIESIVNAKLPDIDWNSQWSIHGQDYHDGYVHIDLAQYDCPGQVIRLQPGPGFGDLSHPTTRLMLKMMSRHVSNRHLIDIGCGSGVLTICGIAMGAISAEGIDIDPDAIVHSKKNAELNDIGDKICFKLSEETVEMIAPHGSIVVMNMIQTEQEAAWQVLRGFCEGATDLITSGILESERQGYLKLVRKWGWELHEEIVEEGWCCFLFGKTSTPYLN